MVIRSRRAVAPRGPPMKRLLMSLKWLQVSVKRLLRGVIPGGKQKARRPAPQPKRRARLGIEWMEERWSPSAF